MLAEKYHNTTLTAKIMFVSNSYQGPHVAYIPVQSGMVELFEALRGQLFAKPTGSNADCCGAVAISMTSGAQTGATQQGGQPCGCLQALAKQSQQPPATNYQRVHQTKRCHEGRGPISRQKFCNGRQITCALAAPQGQQSSWCPRPPCLLSTHHGA